MFNIPVIFDRDIDARTPQIKLKFIRGMIINNIYELWNEFYNSDDTKKRVSGSLIKENQMIDLDVLIKQLNRVDNLIND